MITFAQSPSSTTPGADSRALWLVFFALWLTLLFDSAITAAVPAANEPHYLGKAKHFWDPSWCAGDLLLESSNAHAVFYFVMGSWAKWLSLPQLAWFGRTLGYGLLAWGWLRCHAALGLVRWQSWWSLLIFLALASWGNLSGEWLVGGIEGKVFSYAFLMMAFADWQCGRASLAGLWAGLAISFHPIAGGWAVLAGGLAAGWEWRNDRQSWRSMVGPMSLLIVAALPGLIPALQLIFTNDPTEVRRAATYLQVYYRLAHHLDPMTFSWRGWLGYAALLIFALLSRSFWRSLPEDRLWIRLLCWSGVFAAAGLLAGWGPRPAPNMAYYSERAQLLKFYPFRLLDVLLPLTVSMVVAGFMAHTVTWMTPPRRRTNQIIIGSILLTIFFGGQMFRRALQSPSVFDSPEWLDVCHWVRDHASTTALVQSPTNNPDFKWRAQRAEYVTIKDVPQDSRSIVEWNRRLLFLGKWYQDHYADGLYDNAEVRALRDETGITHILTERLGPFELAPCYTNGRFRVYDLTELTNDEVPLSK
ncbi:MAG: DUF6798 domain-containing protein [Planctomycetaceae bacterium]